MTSPRKYPQLAFNTGEVSPELQGRMDIDKYASGCNYALNFIILDYGGLERRPGFGYVAGAKVLADAPRLLGFTYNDVQAYVIELGGGYARFYMLGGQIYASTPNYLLTTLGGDRMTTLAVAGLATLHLDPSAAPYEIVSPFAIADVFRIQHTSRGDVLWLTHPRYQPRTLTRSAHASWVMEVFSPDTGPFLDPNDAAITVSPSGVAVGEAITLTASADLFVAGHAGALWRIGEDDTNVYGMWEPAKAYIIGNAVRYGNHVYTCTTAGTSGAVAPVHTSGKRYDGQLGVAAEWQHLHPGHGVVRITQYNSPTSVNAVVLSRLPSTAAVTNWREGAWSNYRGWPVACTFQGSRLWFAGTSYQPQTCWGSVAGNPYDFTPGANDDDAVTFTILAQDSNPIRAMSEGVSGLYIFTASRVYAVTGTGGGPIKPDDIIRTPVSRKGSNGVQPVMLDNGILFVDQSGKRVQELSFQIEADRDAARNLNKLASHILRPGR